MRSYAPYFVYKVWAGKHWLLRGEQCGNLKCPTQPQPLRYIESNVDLVAWKRWGPQGFHTDQLYHRRSHCFLWPLMRLVLANKADLVRWPLDKKIPFQKLNIQLWILLKQLEHSLHMHGYPTSVVCEIHYMKPGAQLITDLHRVEKRKRMEQNIRSFTFTMVDRNMRMGLRVLSLYSELGWSFNTRAVIGVLLLSAKIYTHDKDLVSIASAFFMILIKHRLGTTRYEDLGLSKNVDPSRVPHQLAKIQRHW